MITVLFENKPILYIDSDVEGAVLKTICFKATGLDKNDFYLLNNGKLVYDDNNVQNGFVFIVPKLVGGKGGFGSMLRAIGAQIEKTTNREACRDLSGRRLRDINEEKRLKTWIAQQVEREKEVADRKQKKLEKLCKEPKHEFKDTEYDQERSDLTEKVEDAVLQGLKAYDCNPAIVKRKHTEDLVQKKKPRLWVDVDVDDVSSSDDEESDVESKKLNIVEVGECSMSSLSEISAESKDNKLL